MRGLFQKIISFENLHQAYLNARRCKRYRGPMLKFGYRLEKNLLSLQFELANKTYKHGEYREFIVTDSKKRVIRAAPFRDRVAHNALCNIIEPILDKGFIYDSYACRIGKGTHTAVKRLEEFLRSAKGIFPDSRIYCFKCDISKYFDNVDHETLLSILRRKIDDPDVLWLAREIIQSNPRGIPIGNLTSQLFANTYLNELDHYVKRILRERYYIRYMDDFLILGPDKKRLIESKDKIRAFLRDNLKLDLHPKKTNIFPADKGIDFLGYVIKSGERFLRKPTVKRFVKRQTRNWKIVTFNKGDIVSLRNSYLSFRGYAKFADSYRLMVKLGMEGEGKLHVIDDLL